MKVLIISLEFYHDRRQHSIELMNKWGITDYKLIDAVDGIHTDLKSREDYSEEMAFTAIGRPLSNVEIACSLSHRKAYQYIVDEDLDKALIIEDDVVFERGIIDVISEAEKSDFYDILFPGYITYQRTVLRSYWNNRFLAGMRVAPLADHPYGTQGYIVTRKAAQVFLEKTNPVFLPADHTTANYKKYGLRGFGFFPPLILQNDMPSASSTEENQRLRADEPKEKATLKRRISKILKPLFVFK